MAGARTNTRRGIVVAAQDLMSRRGYTAVGINEVLVNAGVPKGSFYHYFASKDAFGEEVMKSYFEDYLTNMDELLSRRGATAAQRLTDYLQYWYTQETVQEAQPKCLAVKLGAEVADLSEPMREALHQGTAGIIRRLERVIDEGTSDGSITAPGDARTWATSIYDLWLGASVRAKIDHGPAPLDNAFARTRDELGL